MAAKLELHYVWLVMRKERKIGQIARKTDNNIRLRDRGKHLSTDLGYILVSEEVNKVIQLISTSG